MKLGRPTFKPRTIAASGVLVIAVLLSFGVWKFWQLQERREQSRDWVHHSRLVIDEVHNLSAKLKDLELGQRGYLLTGDESFLAHYKTALGASVSSKDAAALGTFDARSIQSILESLRSLVSDNPRQLQSVTCLTDLVTLKL